MCKNIFLHEEFRGGTKINLRMPDFSGTIGVIITVKAEPQFQGQCQEFPTLGLASPTGGLTQRGQEYALFITSARVQFSGCTWMLTSKLLAQ